MLPASACTEKAQSVQTLAIHDPQAPCAAAARSLLRKCRQDELRALKRLVAAEDLEQICPLAPQRSQLVVVLNTAQLKMGSSIIAQLSPLLRCHFWIKHPRNYGGALCVKTQTESECGFPSRGHPVCR